MSRFPDTAFLISAADARQFPPDRGVEIAFAGRSNAGKSTAINAIVGRQGLARTSKTPGRTRLLNFFALGPERRIVDLPGYGYASVPESERRTWLPMLEALRQRESLQGLFLIVDVRRGVQAADEELIAWADEAGTRRVHVLLSKADKLGRGEAQRMLKAASAALGGRASVQLFSATSKSGVDTAQAMLQRMLEKRAGVKNPDDLHEIAGAD